MNYTAGGPPDFLSQQRRIEDACGRRVMGLEPIWRGNSRCLRFRIRFERSQSGFAKIATDNLTAQLLRREFSIYDAASS